MFVAKWVLFDTAHTVFCDVVGRTESGFSLFPCNLRVAYAPFFLHVFNKRRESKIAASFVPPTLQVSSQCLLRLWPALLMSVQIFTNGTSPQEHPIHNKKTENDVVCVGLFCVCESE